MENKKANIQSVDLSNLLSNISVNQGLQLLIFCHSGGAYFVPKELIEQSKIHDKNLNDSKDQRQIDDAEAFFSLIRKSYKPIKVGYLLTGDIG